MDINTLSEEDAHALGLSTVVSGGAIVDPDSMMVEAIIEGGGLPQTDRDGRPIISFRQYEQLQKADARLDGYALRMTFPGQKGTWPIQASKYLKWYGLGYRAIGEEANKPKRTAQRPAPVKAAEVPDVTVFMCMDKYPDCKRFFDTKRGLEFHWRKEHGEAPIKKPKGQPEVEADNDAEE